MAATPPSPTLTRRLQAVCAWCQRARDEHGAWQAAGATGPYQPPHWLTHGICPECAAKLLAEAQGPAPAG